MLAKHRAWLSVNEHRRGHIILKTTLWTSIWKVSQYSRSAVSLTWVLLSVRMEQLIKNYQLEFRRPLGHSISLAVYGTVETSRHQLKSGYTLYKVAVLTIILLYGSEVWNIIQTQMKIFKVFHRRCLRRTLKIKWFYHESNADVFKQANIAPVDTFV